MKRNIPYLVLGSVFLLLLAGPTTGATVTDERDLVFGVDDEFHGIQARQSLLNGWVSYEVWVHLSDSTGDIIFEEFHYPLTVGLQYDECDIRPGNTADLVFRLEARDGDGPEFEREFGALAAMDLHLWRPSYQIGLNYAENFVPVLPGGAELDFSQIYFGYNWWARSCLIEADFGLAWGAHFATDEVDLEVEITTPQNPSLVRWESTGTRFNHVQFTSSSAGLATKTLRLQVSLLYVGEIEITTTDAVLSQTEWPRLGPGVMVAKPQCGIRGRDEEVYDYPWQGAGLDSDLGVLEDESDLPSWSFYTRICPPGGGRQDLTHETFRRDESGQPAAGPPVIGEPDRLRTVIRNLHGPICSGYSQVTVAHGLELGGDLLPLGSVVLTDADPALAAFNTGASDELVVDWTYTPGDPNYVFTRDSSWPAGRRTSAYRTTITPVPQAACTDWVVTSALGGGSANDLRRTRFVLPYPDFAILDWDYDEGPPASGPDSVHVFTLRIGNRGADWPPAPAVVMPQDSVFVVATATWQRRLAGVWLDQYNQQIQAELITPLEQGTDRQVHVTYQAPPAWVLAPLQPDRLVITFEVNGAYPGGPWRVWESSFNDNRARAFLPVTDLPRYARPSGDLFPPGAQVLPGYGTVIHHEICPQFAYLYVHDEQLAPPGPADGLLVEFGIGPQGSVASGGEWEWHFVPWLEDMLDDTGRLWKVFQADLCVAPPEPGGRAYAFRASADFQDEDPHYLYVDRDGVGEPAAAGFEPAKVGLLTDEQLSGVTESPERGFYGEVAAWPNPANPGAEITWNLGRAGPVDVTVHDLRGRRLGSWPLGEQPAGPGRFGWDGRDGQGNHLPSGIYFCRVRCAREAVVVKVTLLR